MTQPPSQTPQVGMLAMVRNHRGVVSGVRPFDGNGDGGRLHLVDIEYNDGETPFQESLLWEREPGTRLLEATALPPVESSREPGGWHLWLAAGWHLWLAGTSGRHL